MCTCKRISCINVCGTITPAHKSDEGQVVANMSVGKKCVHKQQLAIVGNEQTRTGFHKFALS